MGKGARAKTVAPAIELRRRRQRARDCSLTENDTGGAERGCKHLPSRQLNPAITDGIETCHASILVQRSVVETRMSTNIKAILGLVGLGIALAVVVFVPAGTLGYWQGWTWLAVFILGSLLLTLYLMVNDPALLRRRMRAGPFAESSPTQRIIMLFVSAGFLALVAVPALDHRFGWSVVPTSVCILGDVLTALMFLLVLPVMSANPFSAGTVQVESGQRVISSGPYAVVRHPMYAAASLTLPGVPLALGSWWG